MSSFQLGWIEGFYGKPWSWEERHEQVRRLSSLGYRHYIYAPKADHRLRRNWREPFGADELRELARLIETCREQDVEFGVGLSPLGLYRSSGPEGAEWKALEAKIRVFNQIGLDRLELLFDDMRGDLPELAKTQTEILQRVRELSRARKLNCCPTYYSDDPVLDRIFGQRPPDYLEELGERLSPEIGVYWTGEKICSTSYEKAHLEEVSRRLRRKPLLWDNYPVNDTPKLCKFLRLRAFTGRPAELSEWLSEHTINPMNQPTLSRVPAETLAMNYAQGESYQPAQAFSEAVRGVCGEGLGRAIEGDLPWFQDAGLDGIPETKKRELLGRYEGFDHPAAREIVAWLEGRSIVTLEQIRQTHGEIGG